MKILIPICCLAGLCIALHRPSQASDLPEQYRVSEITTANWKVWFGIGNADGWIGNDLMITNLTINPFTIYTYIPRDGSYRRFRNEGSSIFKTNPRLTATIKSKTTGEEVKVLISDRVQNTVRLGTNEYFVVDIRGPDQEVLLKDTQTGDLVTLYGTATNKIDSVEHPSGP